MSIRISVRVGTRKMTKNRKCVVWGVQLCSYEEIIIYAGMRLFSDATVLGSPTFLVTISDQMVEIKNADISKDTQQDGIDCATQTMKKCNTEKEHCCLNDENKK